jgi:RAB6A-GEF complex partner protein 2
MPSDIQVFVRFKEHSLFAGEEIQSTITFKNVASVSDNASDYKSWQSRGWAATRRATEHSGPGASGGLSLQNPRLAAINNHGMRKISQSCHKKTASLSTPATGSSGPRSASWTASPVAHSGTSHKHKKSVSIISLGSPDVGNEDTQRAMFPPRTQPTISHSRSASCQVNSGRIVGNYDGLSSCELPFHALRASSYPVCSF